ncbi:hypothetical protein RND71_038755 [Anisodus tanguticus]|uniref:Protein kinase domain-containing protein n=1 Tax=Anisodus tanguticus TaxID=243964 RepID=A0AAE1UZF8_9SOLA|nr:hypothetical protein RND71_038755 [Anisodus tanguticus]
MPELYRNIRLLLEKLLSSDGVLIALPIWNIFYKLLLGYSGCKKLEDGFNWSYQVFEKLGPSLYDFLRKNSYRSFPIDLVREFGRQLLESVVAFMYDLRLIHTDLKPENILLVSSEYIKVPDYKGEALFQTHENLEHLAMMEKVLGPLPQHMAVRADRRAEKYFRRVARLDWPERATSSESMRAVWKLPRLPVIPESKLNPVVQILLVFLFSKRNEPDNATCALLQGLLCYDPTERLKAREAFSRDLRRRGYPISSHICVGRKHQITCGFVEMHTRWFATVIPKKGKEKGQSLSCSRPCYSPSVFLSILSKLAGFSSSSVMNQILSSHTENEPMPTEVHTHIE